MKKITLVLISFALIFSACHRDKDDEPQPDNTTPTTDNYTPPSVTIVHPDPQTHIECVAPPFLKQGDTVALLSPAYQTDEANVEATAEIIKSWGLVPIIGYNSNNLYKNKYAGTVDERRADLMWAYEHKNVKAIICNRGGYGAIQMLDLIPLSTYNINPKWIVGFSDITTLHAASVRAGVMSIHGTMSSFIASQPNSDNTIKLKELLFGNVPEYHVNAHKFNKTGTAEGVLVGGNFATFSPLVGTGYDFTTADNIILFIEEVGESFHNLDRMVNILALHGVINNVNGVILGSFSDCSADLGYSSAEELITEYFNGLDIPICCGFPAGHGGNILPLIEGAPITLSVTENGADVKFNLQEAL